MHYVVRRARLRDLPAIVNIMRHGFPNWYRRIPYLVSATFVIESANNIFGFVAVPVRKGIGEIGGIAVSRGCQGSGLGSRLLSKALWYLRQQGASSCLAKVRHSNKPAERLFAKAGFSSKRVLRRRILGDVLLMERNLTEKTNIGGAKNHRR